LFPFSPFGILLASAGKFRPVELSNKCGGIPCRTTHRLFAFVFFDVAPSLQTLDSFVKYDFGPSCMYVKIVFFQQLLPLLGSLPLEPLHSVSESLTQGTRCSFGPQPLEPPMAADPPIPPLTAPSPPPPPKSILVAFYIPRACDSSSNPGAFYLFERFHPAPVFLPSPGTFLATPWLVIQSVLSGPRGLPALPPPPPLFCVDGLRFLTPRGLWNERDWYRTLVMERAPDLGAAHIPLDFPQATTLVSVDLETRTTGML